MQAEQLDRTSEVTHFAAACRWTGVTDADRSSWLSERHKLVTASRVAALLGLSTWQDELGVYVDMVMPPANEVDEGLDSPKLWGSVLEDAIAATAARHYGWELSKGGALLVSREHPDLGATLDDEIRPPGSPDWLIYEGKTTSAFRSGDWTADGGMPDHIMAQVQTQLLVTRAPAAVVFCLVGGQKPRRVDVQPSEEFFEVILETVAEFMGRVRRLDPPPPGATSKTALTRLYPQDTGEVVTLPAEAVEWTRELQELATQAKETKRRDDELRNLLRAAIGSATIGELPEVVGGKSQWRWQVQERAGYVVQPSSSRVLTALKGTAKKSTKKEISTP